MVGPVQPARQTSETDPTRPLSSQASTGIELFRIAALAIIAASHVGFMDIPTHGGHLLSRVLKVGWFGTDMFLVLAGFLCVHSLDHESARPPASERYRNYLLRRAGRTLPAYFAFLALYLFALPGLMAALGLSSALPVALREPGAAYDAAAPYLWTTSANIYYALAGRGPGAALEAMFAVGVGVQATLLVSAIMVFLPKQQRYRALGAMLLLTWVTRIALFRDPWPYTLYANPLTRWEPFVLGALLARWLVGPKRALIERHAARVALWATLCIVPLAAASDSLSIYHPLTKLVGFPLVSLASTATLAWVLTRTGPLPAPLRSASRLGPWVYGMFLVKLPLLSYVDHAMDAGGLSPASHAILFPLLGGIATLVLGGALYRAIERPTARALGALPSYQRPRVEHAATALGANHNGPDRAHGTP